METSNAYQSIYDGPSIDAAIARASEGGYIDAAIQAKPNQNLLDNWHFGNPVNQRGQTEYASSNDTSESYGIDRWKQTGTLAVNEGCVAVSNTKVPILRQRLENPNIYRGKTLTFSVQVKSALSNLVLHIRYNNFVNAAVNGFTNIPAGGVISVTAVIPDVDLTALFVQCSSESVKEFALVAAKLELGSQQTLAHKDANGNWVLNEIPDYGEQLRRCQRYFQLYSAADKRPAKAVDCRPTMRTDPSQGTIVIDGTVYYNTAEL